jgi:hypothetical protein
VEAILGRQLRAERLLDSKVRLRSQVSEAEVRRHYDAHPELHDRSYEVERPLLREKLSRDRYQSLVAQELEKARRTADVRLVAPWARAPAEIQGGQQR